METQGLYIHVPFCKSRCIYCDFYSTTCGEADKTNFVGALEAEAVERADFLPSTQMDTLYIGGGTPSSLGVEHLRAVLEMAGRLFSVAEGAEVTVELNPDDVTPRLAEMLLRQGVNRVSMGVQTFDDDKLRFLRRRHTARTAETAVFTLLDAGIDNVSIDLIYGLPGQTLGQWTADVERAFRLPVSHLSAYALMYEEGTRLYTLRETGAISEADEELSLEMFRTLMRLTGEAGFRHYEISNFAKPGRPARHNTGYWTGMRYLGLGPGAHSYNGRVRSFNAPDLGAYLRAGGRVTTSGLLETEVLTDVQMREESLLTSLRTAAGLDLLDFASRFGRPALDCLLSRARPYINAGRLALLRSASDSFVAPLPAPPDYPANPARLALTTDGIFVSDDIISSLFD